jgi:hypothetical protein
MKYLRKKEDLPSINAITTGEKQLTQDIGTWRAVMIQGGDDDFRCSGHACGEPPFQGARISAPKREKPLLDLLLFRTPSVLIHMAKFFASWFESLSTDCRVLDTKLSRQEWSIEQAGRSECDGSARNQPG